MKALIVLGTILFSIASFPAHAASNNTPHAIACMKKNGFTPEMWRARRAGTNAQVQSYIACRDGISLREATEKGRENGNFNTWNETHRKGATCSKLVAECVTFNKRGGYDTKRCEGYRASCMATGVYKDRNRTITDVIRR
jgi:hypothetical protein